MAQRFGFSAARAVHAYIRDNCDQLFICTTAPASYSAASNQPQKLVSANVTADEWTFSSGAQGPALTFNSRTLTIEGSGSASHMVWARSSGSTILALTDVCAGTVFSSGNTVTVPAWRTEIVGGDVFRTVFATQGETVAAPMIFSPNNLPDLQLWLAPDSGVTVTAGRVTQWNDKSGNGYHATQVFLSSMPNHASAVADMNGFNAVGFVDARDTRLYITNAIPACAIATSAHRRFSGAIVFENSATNVTDVIITVGQTSADAVNARQLRMTAGAYTATETVASTNSAKSFGSAKTTPVVYRWVWSSGDISAWENGVNLIASAKVCAGSDLTLGTAPKICLGASQTGSSPLNGHVAEVIIMSTAMASAQGRELDKLLGAKYGITIT